MDPPENLICPITKDLLHDPITLPCCGRAISRTPLQHYLTNYDTMCPVCRHDLNDFDANTAPRAINIAYIIEELNNQIPAEHTKPNEPNKPNEPKFTAKLYPINDPSYRTKVAKLEIKSTEILFKTLIIPVIDISGSMSNSPINQAKYSLTRIVDLTFQNPSNITSIVCYNDNYNIINIDTMNSSELHYKTLVNNLQAGGGTSFSAAFKGICEIINKHKDQSNISNIVVIFLTDGEDSNITAQNRSQLVDKLKSDLLVLTNKPITIHTIGFGTQHDYDFLNNLRLSCLEGCYKYANPSEDLDSLSNKVNSIIDVIMNNNYVPLKILDDLNIIHDYKDNSYFLNITDKQLHTIQIQVDNQCIIILVELQEPNLPNIKATWYSYLIDQAAQEIMQLSQHDINVLDNKVHIELLERRCKAISTRVTNVEDNNNLIRINKLLNMIRDIKKNIKLDKLTLTDLASQGKFVSNNNNHNINTTLATNNYYSNTTTITVIENVVNGSNKLEYVNKHKTKHNLFKNYDQKFLNIPTLNNSDAIKLIEQNQSHATNLLTLCSSIGRIKLVKYLLTINSINPESTDKYNALDYAIMNGFWITCGMLFDKNILPTINSDLLFTTCIYYNYFKTASLLIEKKIVSCTPKFLNYDLSPKQMNFINNNNTAEIDLETAIIKGLYDKVITHNEKVSWNILLKIITKLNEEHYKIIEYLINNNQLDPNEIMQKEDQIIWPLFCACERGILELYNLLINHTDPNSLNKQNEKGTTVLWIASCNKHVDIVFDLLNKGADPNICNFKGDSPLIATIQKGAKVIVELLLEYNADMKLNNVNRDNCILIACRNGQSEILDVLLSKTDPETKQKYLETYAEIDGFCPLLASTELDRTGCIRILHKHGANMQIRSENDNKVLPGANALHLASHYNRINSLKCLIELGCELTEQTSVDKLTVLHIAIKQCHNEMTRYLLSLPVGQKCLKIYDNSGKLPSYYANSAGNEEILEEFFNDTLANCLSDVINTAKINKDLTKKCTDKIIQYGQSLTCYEHNDVLDTNVGIDKFSTYSILTGNDDLINIVDNVMADTNMFIGDNADNTDTSNTNNNDHEFWKCLVNKQKSTNQKVNEELNRIKQIESNIQNRILLDTKTINKLIMPKNETDELNQNAKMNNGFDLQIDDTVLNKLKNSKKLISLLGFLDKMKDKKTLEYLMTEAKINAIKKIRSGSKLNPLHLIVLYLYTGHFEIHNQVNNTLTNWNIKNMYCPFTECLYQAINCLDIYDGEVYRSINTMYDSNKYDIGNVITWNTFSIASYVWNSANSQIEKKCGMIFIIKNKTGRLLAPYSKYEADAEIVFLPGMTFKITNHYKSSIFCLGQANIRNSTFKIDLSYYAKVNLGQESIIVELEEI